jgi:hypothetical protein
MVMHACHSTKCTSGVGNLEMVGRLWQTLLAQVRHTELRPLSVLQQLKPY